MSSKIEGSIERAFKQAAAHRLRDEFLPRLQKSVALLDEGEIWRRDNTHTNSVGVLLLHLDGNVRQWILAGLGGARDERRRELEFSPVQEESGAILLARLERTVLDAVDVILSVSGQQLVETQDFQGFPQSGVGAILHVVEHFSYHLGQISHIVKTIKSVDLNYFQGHDLNRHNK